MGVICITVPLARGQEEPPSDVKISSPGEIALMVRRVENPQVIESLRLALRHGGPRERSAAARVANAGRVGALVGDLREALEKETDPRAAFEEAAAFAGLAGPEQDSRVLDAGRRLGDPSLASFGLILARARGAAAITAYLQDLKSTLDANSKLVAFLRLATNKDPAALASAAGNALESNDAVVWLAALAVSTNSDTPLETGLLVSALTHSSTRISGETAWHLAEVLARKPETRPRDLLAAIETSAGAPGSSTAGPDLDFGFELLARTLGRKPVKSRAWLDHLEGSGRSRFDVTDTRFILTGTLTSTERKVLEKRLERLQPDATMPALRPALRRVMKPPTDPQPRSPIFQLATGFPEQYVSSLVAARGCLLDPGPAVGEAEITFDQFGRPSNVSLIRVPPSIECYETITALFSSALVPLGDPEAPEGTRKLFLVLQRQFLSSLEEAAEPQSEGGPVSLVASGVPRMEPPKRTHYIKPIYPPSARRAAKEGRVILEVVVDRTGLISDIRLLRASDEVFVAPTFIAVAQWRYAPGTQDGRPVPLYLTVIVDYNLE